MPASHALILTPQPSRQLKALVFVAHGAAAMAIGMAALDWRYRAVLWSVVALGLWSSLRKKPDITFRCRADGGLDIQAGEHWQPVQLLPDSLVWPWLVVLRYRHDGGQSISAPMLSDSLNANDFRRLKVWVKWRAVTGELASQPHTI